MTIVNFKQNNLEISYEVVAHDLEQTQKLVKELENTDVKFDIDEVDGKFVFNYLGWYE